MPDTFCVSRETREILVAYTQILKKWNRTINLVSRGDISDLWSRHIENSLHVLSPRCPAGTWLDMGSGGGFPGMVVAIGLRERTDIPVILVESDQRKAAFLRHVAQSLNLDVQVRAARVESLTDINAKTISARALAPLRNLIALGLPHLAEGGRMLFLKGKNVQAELATAQQQWTFTHRICQSDGDPNSVLLEIRNIV